MSKFTIDQVTGHNTLSVFLMSVMTDSTKRGEDFLAKFQIEHGREPRELDVRLTVNGVEVDFEQFIKRLERDYDEYVKRDAKKLLSEKCETIENVLYQLTEHVKRVGTEALGIEYYTED